MSVEILRGGGAKKLGVDDEEKMGNEEEEMSGGGGGEPSDGAGHYDSDQEKQKHQLAHKSNAAASLCSSDNDEEDDEKPAVPLGPQVPLKDQLEMDKDDESLRRWKEQLLGSVDLSDVGDVADPEVKIESLTIVSPGRPGLVLPMPFSPDAKGYAFCLKDGSRYALRFSFTVSNNIVSGLRYTNTVWKTGVRVENTKVMLGTFSPQKEPYSYEREEETTPSGIFTRVSYSAKTKFVDDDGKCYLDISYFFEIRKEWQSST